MESTNGQCAICASFSHSVGLVSLVPRLFWHPPPSTSDSLFVCACCRSDLDVAILTPFAPALRAAIAHPEFDIENDTVYYQLVTDRVVKIIVPDAAVTDNVDIAGERFSVIDVSEYVEPMHEGVLREKCRAIPLNCAGAASYVWKIPVSPQMALDGAILRSQSFGNTPAVLEEDEVSDDLPGQVIPLAEYQQTLLGLLQNLQKLQKGEICPHPCPCRFHPRDEGNKEA